MNGDLKVLRSATGKIALRCSAKEPIPLMDVIELRFGTYSTTEAVTSGLDLEMPGATRWRGGLLAAAISAMALSMNTLDLRVRSVLQLVQQASKCDVSQEESIQDTPEDRKILRRLASESIVLLKNTDTVLPWRAVESVGVIGTHAKSAAYCGGMQSLFLAKSSVRQLIVPGGSAQLSPYYVVTPMEGLLSHVQNIVYCPGTYSHQLQPLLGPYIKSTKGLPGVTVTFYNEDHTKNNRKALEEVEIADSAFQLLDYRPTEASDVFYATVRGTITPENTGIWDFGVMCHGTALLYINDTLVVDNATQQRAGRSFFGSGTAEELGFIKLEAKAKYDIRLEWGNSRTTNLQRRGATTLSNGGARMGGCPRMDPHQAIEEAISMAKSQKHVVVFAGLNVSHILEECICC
jgi:beta-glucosidase